MSDHAKLLAELEPSQLAAAAPLPRRKLGKGLLFVLIGLRIYILIAIPIVAYTFIRALLAI